MGILVQGIYRIYYSTLKYFHLLYMIKSYFQMNVWLMMSIFLMRNNTKEWKRTERNGSYIIQCNCIALGNTEKVLIKEVYDAFSWYGPRALHEMVKYDKASIRITRDQSNNRIFTKDNLREYYKEVLVRYNISNVNEINRYPRMRLREISERVK